VGTAVRRMGGIAMAHWSPPSPPHPLNAGVIGPGDLQWMTAGRGIVHSEIPTGGRGTGLQLWVNLPRKHKVRPHPRLPLWRFTAEPHA
jgi:hypothetical protein